MRACVLLLLALTSAWSAAATVTWAHPTTRVDGVDLPLAEIAATRIEWAREGEPFSDALTVPAPEGHGDGKDAIAQHFHAHWADAIGGPP